MGLVKKDTVWTGELCVTGDVLVPAGVTLRIDAGTRIKFGERPRWSCSVFWRSSEGDDSIEASRRNLCDLVVTGRLEVAGTREAQVCLGTDGTPWGGITCLEHGVADLDHAHLVNASEVAVQAFDEATVEGEDSHCSGSQWGLWTWGSSRARWAGGSIGAERASVICCEGSRAHIADVDDRSVEGVATTDWSLMRVDRCRFLGPRKHCVVARNRSWVKLSHCQTVGDVHMDVVRLDDAQVEMRA